MKLRHINIMIKPASGNCNMRCRYCFYHDVSELREVKSYGIMSEETLEKIVKKVLETAEESCAFVFQGGEPTLAGLDYFRSLVDFQKKYNTKKIEVSNSIQTNGLKIDEEWAEFLHENHFLVGLSIDGTKDIHDRLRPDAAGKETYNRIYRTAQLLKKYQVEFNILTVITRQSARRAYKIYHQYKKNGWRYLQFIPCLDPYEWERGSSDYSLTPELYTEFLKTLFDEWFADQIKGDSVYIRYFDNLLGIQMGVEPESCGLMGRCIPQLVIEADGSAYPCDFYVMDEYRMGNLAEEPLEQLMQSEGALRFAMESAQPEEKCKTCRFGYLCRGGCRRDRDDRGAVGLNYYCESYQEFLAYAEKNLQALAEYYSEP
ncbi:anaerobic sulfatase maturase [Hominifimenecus sp. rT4P-3]|uniref:anaerobic sulfatase maturase n=1 Tax=Hominifimenecus sp. rT4P-3 TaxID=3242979 RepID=UPI003DA61ACB